MVVVGAGSTGSSTAYHLAKLGRSVILLDRGQVGSGMTSRSTALVRTHYSNEIVARMALYSLNFFKENKECGFVNSGILIIGPDSARGAIESNVTMLDSIGVRNERLTPSMAREEYPELELTDTDFVVSEPESGYADPVSTANYYAARAAELGAKLVLGDQVATLKRRDRKLVGLELASGKVIDCEEAILCTNAWTNAILSASGVDAGQLLPLWAAAHPVLILRRPNSYLGIRPAILDVSSKAYYKPEGRSLFFAGSLDPELDRQSTNPESPPTDVPFELISNLSESVAKRIPTMKEASFHSSYIGIYDMTSDQHPIIDSLSHLGFEGLYCCVGLSGHGFKLCPALGLMNAEMISGRRGQFDWTRFKLERFRLGEELKSKYTELGTVA